MFCAKLHVRRDYQLDDVHALRVLTRLYFLTFSTNFPFAEVPEHRPAISGIRIRYRVGDIFRANCTSRNSKPAANLTWSINDHPVSHFNHGYIASLPQHICHRYAIKSKLHIYSSENTFG